jgi:hypothetical protein
LTRLSLFRFAWTIRLGEQGTLFVSLAAQRRARESDGIARASNSESWLRNWAEKIQA